MSGTFEQTPIWIFSDSPFATFVAVVDDYATLRFKRGWYAPGDFEITINKNTLYAAEFVKGRIIRVGDDNSKVGYIDDVRKVVDQGGAQTEILTIKGHELTQWLDRRNILPPVGEAYYAPSTTLPIETIIKGVITANMGSGAAVVRRDTDLQIATDLGRGPTYTFSSRYANLLGDVSAALLATSTGIFATLSPSTNKWILDFGVGTDRTATVVFSTDRETTQSASLQDSDIAYKNVAIVAGQGEGANRTIRTVWLDSEPSGRGRREMFVDARDLSVVASLDKRGEQKLAENQYTQYLKVDALAYSQIVYGVDYFVGDKVTVSQFGVTQQVYITSVEEQWKPGYYDISLGFDRATPTITGQVSAAAGAVTQTLARVEMGIPILPLSSAISSDTIYTIENSVGIRTILIPYSRLKASSNGPFTLTITTGVGGASSVSIPISHSGDVITSGDLLFDIYIDSNGSVRSDTWSISGYNSRGRYIKHSNGVKEQYGYDNTIYGPHSSVDIPYVYPEPFIGPPPSVTGSARPLSSWNGVSVVGISFFGGSGGSLTGCTVHFESASSQTNTDTCWKAIGMWK